MPAQNPMPSWEMVPVDVIHHHPWREGSQRQMGLLQQDPQHLPTGASPLAALPRRRCATKCSQVSCANAPTGISLSSFLLFTHSPQPISATKTKIKGKLTMPRFPNASGSSEESCSTKKSCQPLFLSCYKQRTPLQAFTEKRSQEVTRLELATSAANGITPNT